MGKIRKERHTKVLTARKKGGGKIKILQKNFPCWCEGFDFKFAPYFQNENQNRFLSESRNLDATMIKIRFKRNRIFENWSGCEVEERFLNIYAEIVQQHAAN